MSNSNLESLVRDIVGQRCEDAVNSYGSTLIFDFGPLGLRADDEPSAPLLGWRSFLISSPWRLESKTEIVCDWNTEGGFNGKINPVVKTLVGQHVAAADTAPPGWDLRIRWSNGLTLVVFGDSTDDEHDAWFIHGTDGARAAAFLVRRTPVEDRYPDDNWDANREAERTGREFGLNRAGVRALHDEITRRESRVGHIRDIGPDLANQTKYLGTPSSRRDEVVMSNSNPESLVRDIVGQRCEAAKNNYGSLLSLDFGPLALRADDDPSATPHGWRNLMIFSPWRLETETEILCDWNTEGGVTGKINPVVETLVGQHVVAADTAPPGWDLRLRWSDGLSLVVFGDGLRGDDDAWFIIGTDGAEAGAIPVMGDRA